MAATLRKEKMKWQSGSVTTESASREKGPRAKGLGLSSSDLEGTTSSKPSRKRGPGQKQNKHKQKSSGISSMINTIAPPAIKTLLSLWMKFLSRGRRHRRKVGRMTRSAQYH